MDDYYDDEFGFVPEDIYGDYENYEDTDNEEPEFDYGDEPEIEKESEDELEEAQQTFGEAYSDLTRMGGQMSTDRRTDMYNSQLKRALQNRPENLDRYYEDILKLENYTRLNPELLADALEIAVQNTPKKDLLKKFRDYSTKYKPADILRYLRFINNSLT